MAALSPPCAQTQVEARHSVTRRLELAYHKRTPLDRPLRARAEVTEERDRRVTVQATLHDGDEILVEAAATFRRPRSSQ